MEFKEIPGFENYLINENGLVVKKLKPRLNKGTKYHQIVLTKPGHRKNIYIHKLVGITYLGANYNLEKMCINHKDGDKTNNNINNLEWITFSENIKHAYSTGLRKPTMHMVGKSGFLHHNSHHIQVVDSKNSRIFGSIRECAKALKIARSTINKYIKSGELFNNLQFIKHE